MNLPAELLSEIVSRTPVRTIVYCKCVCKKWHNILSEPYFANLHLSRSSEEFMIHQGGSRDCEFAILPLVEVDDKREQHDIHRNPLTRFELGLDSEYRVILLSGSVNGLICLEDNDEDSVYILNPITQEYIYLENPKYTKKAHLKVRYGFGFAESNNQYKVVHFYKDSCPSTEGSCKLGSEVYTLGTAMWRDLGRVPFRISEWDIGFYVSGNLHWLADDDEIICTFNLEKEVFQPMATAPRVSGVRFVNYRSLGVLKGCLCICDNMPSSELVIWVMRDYGVENSWHKEIVIPTHLIHNHIYTDMIRLITVLEDGTILMYSEGFELSTYHPRHQTFQHDIFLGGDTIDALTCIPNFTSLNSFGLEDVFTW